MNHSVASRDPYQKTWPPERLIDIHLGTFAATEKGCSNAHKVGGAVSHDGFAGKIGDGGGEGSASGRAEMASVLQKEE